MIQNSKDIGSFNKLLEFNSQNKMPALSISVTDEAYANFHYIQAISFSLAMIEHFVKW